MFDFYHVAPWVLICESLLQCPNWRWPPDTSTPQQETALPEPPPVRSVHVEDVPVTDHAPPTIPLQQYPPLELNSTPGCFIGVNTMKKPPLPHLVIDSQESVLLRNINNPQWLTGFCPYLPFVPRKGTKFRQRPLSCLSVNVMEHIHFLSPEKWTIGFELTDRWLELEKLLEICLIAVMESPGFLFPLDFGLITRPSAVMPENRQAWSSILNMEIGGEIHNTIIHTC